MMAITLFNRVYFSVVVFFSKSILIDLQTCFRRRLNLKRSRIECHFRLLVYLVQYIDLLLLCARMRHSLRHAPCTCPLLIRYSSPVSQWFVAEWKYYWGGQFCKVELCKTTYISNSLYSGVCLWFVCTCRSQL